MATVYNIQQGTDDWFAARLGKVTASRVADVIAKTKTGVSASRMNYMAQLVCERLTGTAAESYSNAAMQWGIDHEADAAAAYTFHHDTELEPIGFVDHPRIAMSGASPDRLVGTVGLVEIKCPNTATHINILDCGKVPEKYLTQMQWQMACCNRDWCDFVSYDPRMPEEMRLFVKRVERDGSRISELETEVAAFLNEVDETVARLWERYASNDWRNNILMAG